MATVPTITGNDTVRARPADPLTSHAAADSNENRLLVKAIVLRLITDRPMTDHELTTAYFQQPDYVVADFDSPRKRRSGLTKDDAIVWTGEKRAGRTKRQVNVWGVAA
ncbi:MULTISPECIES: hypothetical protein [Cryobacterium]|uniref:Uncharacterized protein n=1 Tax=Cryobacterium breve TaxID=1259258 RepID=A0ABY2J4H9_9MICO|nr:MULTISPECIES: hypothetical protein [Cryobacterium]TFC92077.1 hypothetical protein E3T20_12240 [Cryobacterium sp. TmT3-12]TFC99784.1 hypothetical protein E3O65_05265 [Cryobacterium breve]